MSRYENMFHALSAAEKPSGAFVPFLMLNDPSPEESMEIIRTVIAAGADALELGVPFSDPVADGPTIQKAHIRALAGGATVDKCLAQIRQIRSEFPDIPIGMLIYGNVPFTRGVDKFYTEFHEAGADSVLLPDIPVREGVPFASAAVEAGVDPIFIAPAQASEEVLRGVAAHSKGYIYAISRDGVTGAEKESSTTGLADVVTNASKFGGAPVLLGFGISTPQHVADAIAAGAAGAITGSAISKIIERYLVDAPERESFSEHDLPAQKVSDMEGLKKELSEYVSAMKAATSK
ncbi:tryptophan synthase subunit alpha [Corynebacterium renale]|uniref:tryptophan synthase subunit alpha n=1 Tax=Corynebacterium renale TaxID=1724 RepID=UPI0006532D57|nr:tryptophan synthase subunit alpha [Corynebacterium renale]